MRSVVFLTVVMMFVPICGEEETAAKRRQGAANADHNHIATSQLTTILPQSGDKEQPMPTTDVEAIKKKALDALKKSARYIKKIQNEQGQVGKIPGAGITSIVALAFANSPIRDDYKAIVDNATAFVMKFLKEDGSINDGQGHIAYKTSVALSLLCNLPEADKKRYPQQIAAMVEYLIKAQNWNEIVKEDINNGGWGYDARKKENRSDLSNTSFVLQALHDAGVPKDNPVWRRAVVFLSRCQNNPETNDAKLEGIKNTNDGGFRYGPALRSNVTVRNPDGTVSYPSYGSMTYAGLLSMIYAFVTKDDARVQAAIGWVKRNYTLDENPGMSEKRYGPESKQGLYYYYSTLAKALYHYGERYLVDSEGNKHDWGVELIEKLVSLQKEDGSWVNENDRWFEADPALSTSYAIISLSYAIRALSELK
ncbi:MAG: terpene cyclase/mutase family protein [Planctomycetota bacterium]|nr:terpene cyclase/mutase family protein [Planctomycetota bacterium]